MVFVVEGNEKIALIDYRKQRGFKSGRSFARFVDLPYTAYRGLEVEDTLLTEERAKKIAKGFRIKVSQLMWVKCSTEDEDKSSQVKSIKKDKLLLELELNKLYGDKLAPVRYSLAAGQKIKGLRGMNRIDPWRKEKTVSGCNQKRR